MASAGTGDTLASKVYSLILLWIAVTCAAQEQDAARRPDSTGRAVIEAVETTSFDRLSEFTLAELRKMLGDRSCPLTERAVRALHDMRDLRADDLLGSLLCGPPIDPRTRRGILAGFSTRTDVTLHEPTRVRIYSEIGAQTFAPLELIPPERALAEPVSRHGARRAKRLIQRALGVYPPLLVALYLDRVQVVGRLTCGVPMAGTYGERSIFVVVGKHHEGYTDEFVSRIFHAELSSVLMRAHLSRFPFDEWRRANPPGFAYFGSGQRAIRAGRAENVLTPGHGHRSFLSEYAASSLENDFNSIAGALFSGKMSVQSLRAASPSIAHKTELTMQFYRAVCPVLTDEYFSQLACQAQ